MRTFSMILAALLLAGSIPITVTAADGAKQPVFLMCPHKKRYSAWSIYVVPDPSNPAKIATLGLDKMTGQNSEDNPNGFAGVMDAQKNASTPVENLGTLSAAEFGKGKIEIEKDDALRLSLEEATGGDYRLVIKMRCTSDKYLEVGGKAVKMRDILLKYDKAANKWYAYAAVMKSIDEDDVIPPPGAPIQGINFPVIGTGIYRIVGVLGNGEQVLIIDGWRKQ
jgi:hypothetical protein